MRLGKLLSGGQTGVDRAALDVALTLGLPYGGWCPAGGWAEDMPTPPGVLTRYPGLREALGAGPAERTLLNVRDSDATLLLRPRNRGRPARSIAAASPGSDLTEQAAARLGRPLAVVDPARPDAASHVRAWIDSLPPSATLNLAGPRESEAPGIYARARQLLQEALQDRGSVRAKA
ncbi:MAG: putative molybdenum carrier protein [Solirubrobacteraceae bacterium]